MKYAQVEQNTIINIVVADPQIATLMGLVQIQDDVCKGWVLVNGQWQAPETDQTIVLSTWTVGQFRDLFTIREQVMLDNPLLLPDTIPMSGKMALESFKTDLLTRTEIERTNPRLVFGIALLQKLQLLEGDRPSLIIQALLACNAHKANALLDSAANDINDVL